MITLTAHEKSEWSRMAQAAYKVGLNHVGTRYSVAASLPADARMSEGRFDELQRDYRAWLTHNVFPVIA